MVLNDDALPSDCFQIYRRYPRVMPLRRCVGITDQFIFREVELMLNQETLTGGVRGTKEGQKIQNQEHGDWQSQIKLHFLFHGIIVSGLDSMLY